MVRGRARHTGIAAAVSACLVMASVLPAGSSSSDSDGTTSAAFLKIPIGARVTAVPEIVAGARPDGSMLFANPSNLARIPHGEFFFTSAQWLDEFTLSAASGTVPFKSVGITWSAGARLLYAGDLQGYDAAGSVVATEQYYDMALTTGLAKNFDRAGLAIGGSVTYIREHLAVEDGTGVTFSLGAAIQRGRHRAELMAQDFGGSLAFDDRSYDIAGRTTFGYGYTFRQSLGNVHLGSQVTVSDGDFRRFQVGVAVDPSRYLTLMSGLDQTSSAAGNEGLPFSAGLSVHVGALSVDYAYTPRQYFSDTHTFSMRFAFGRPGTGAPPSQPIETLAPVLPSSPAARPAPTVQESSVSYAIVAGSHGRYESARAEARALQLLKIPALVQQVGTMYWVIVERFDDKKSAESALEGYRSRGHHFEVIAGRE